MIKEDSFIPLICSKAEKVRIIFDNKDYNILLSNKKLYIYDKKNKNHTEIENTELKDIQKTNKIDKRKCILDMLEHIAGILGAILLATALSFVMYHTVDFPSFLFALAVACTLAGTIIVAIVTEFPRMNEKQYQINGLEITTVNKINVLWFNNLEDNTVDNLFNEIVNAKSYNDRKTI